MPTLARALPDAFLKPLSGGRQNVGMGAIVTGMVAQHLGLLAIEAGDDRIQPLPNFSGCHAANMRPRVQLKHGSVATKVGGSAGQKADGVMTSSDTMASPHA